MNEQPRAWMYHEDGRLTEVEARLVGVDDFIHYETPGDESTRRDYCRSRILGTPHFLYVWCGRDANGIPPAAQAEVRRLASGPS